jgi:protein-disulfide isomerase
MNWKADMEEHNTPLETQPKTSAAPYMIVAAIFFVLGFMLNYLLVTMNDDDTTAEPAASGSVAEAVNATLTALVPTPTPLPTRAPVEETYSLTDYRMGDPDAPIKIVEFSDYQCGFCARFAITTLTELMERYDGYIEFIYRDYTIFGEASVQTALGGYCANEQGLFWEYHNTIFLSQAQEQRVALNLQSIPLLAEQAGVDVEAFNTCLADEATYDAVIANVNDAATLVGRAGTPTFLVNGRRVVGAQPLQNFIQIIDEELRAMGIEPPAG